MDEKLGFILNNIWHYWGEPVDRVSILLRRVRGTVFNVINFAALIAALFFTVAFAYGLTAVNIVSAGFWSDPNVYQLAFWADVLVILFLFYRFQESGRVRERVPKKSFKESPDISLVQSVPSANLKRHNVSLAFNAEAKRSIEDAFEIAANSSHAKVGPLHLFLGACSTVPVNILFRRLGISFEKIKDPIWRHLLAIETGKTKFTNAAEAVLLAAYVNAYKTGRSTVGPIEIFTEAFKADEFLKELFYGLNLDSEKMNRAVEWIRINEKLRDRYREFSRAAVRKPRGAMNRAYTARVTPLLDSVSEDLTLSAARGRLPLLVGREEQMHEIFRVIEGGGQSVALVGEPGVGKDAILDGLAELMVEEQVPKILGDKRLVRLSLPHLLVGSVADAEMRLLQALSDVALSGNIVLAIENLDQLPSELMNTLAAELERGYTFLIATASPRGYVEKIEPSPLAGRLVKVEVEEPDFDLAVKILESKIGFIEYQNKVLFSFEALEKCVELTKRYLHEIRLPEGAIEAAREVALEVRQKRGEGAVVSAADVEKLISQKSKVPVEAVASEEKTKLLHLEDEMHKRMIGQDEAVRAVAAALKRARTALAPTNRPIGSFLFLGPTGVGKTELAKTTAAVYFGSESSMLRFDMSEYQEQSSIGRLIGDGGTAGLMTEAVRQNPFSLLLLDELEKAHPDILNLFLQVMDDGRLTDASGRTIDFTNTIIIATSNAGTLYIQEAIGRAEPLDQIKEHLLETELKQVYRPEFLNRFDGIVVFKPLTMDEVAQIAYLMIGALAERLDAEKGIHFEASDEAVNELAKKGFDPKFGARPLRRVIQEEVQNAIANFLLQGQVGRRDKLILESGGQIRVEKAKEL